MPDSTPNRALPFPQGIDVPDVPLWLGQLAAALDFDMHVITDAVRPAAGELSRIHRDPATGAWSLDTGAAWVDLPTGGPYLPTAGGVLTGFLDLAGQELRNALTVERRGKVATVAAAGAARTLDAAVAPLHDVTLDQNVTFTFSGVDGDELNLILRQPAAVKTVAWPATVDWDSGEAPRQIASTVVVHKFTRIAGRWLGSHNAKLDVPDIQAFGVGAGLWTKPTFATDVEVICIGGGGGGGTGRRGAAGSLRNGGGGGGGGGYSRQSFAAADLGATENVVVGAGGAGHAANAVDNSDGGDGTNGGNSTFSALPKLVQGNGGGAGGGGTAAAGGGGGTLGFGLSGGLFAGGAGGAASNVGGAGAAGAVGAGGAAGGGAGGGVTAGNVSSGGGIGGGPAITNGTGGGIAGIIQGGAGGAAANVPASSGKPGAAGGGGAGGTGVGGAGGAGGKWGAGGGGGGASTNTNAAGKGGDGAVGLVLVISR